MKNTRFTPGPWRTGDKFKAKVFAERPEGLMTVCDIRGWGFLTGVGGLHLPEKEAIAIQDANCHLIVAAPDLYAALTEMLQCYDVPREACVKAHAALAKARGEDIP